MAKQDKFEAIKRRLEEDRIQFRISRRPKHRTRVILITDLGPVWRMESDKPTIFSSKTFVWCDSEGHVTEAIEEQLDLLDRTCRQSHRAGKWKGIAIERHDLRQGGWPGFALAVWASILKKSGTKKPASLKDYKSFLFNHIQDFDGPVRRQTIEAWVKLTSPEKRRAWEKRRDLCSHITKSGLMNMDAFVKWMNDELPAQSKTKKKLTMEPRAIANHDEIAAWLRSIPSRELRTVLALIATYGLRAHEVWHVEKISEMGRAFVAFGKTGERWAYPVPRAWVDEFELEENLADARAWMLANSKVLQKPFKLVDGSVGIPAGHHVKPLFDADHIECLNNPELGEEVSRWMDNRNLCPPCEGLVGGSADRDELVAYDLRHCFAINLMDCDEVRHKSVETYANWMGHSMTVHKDTYRRWIPPERLEEMADNEVDAPPAQVAPQGQGLPADVQAKLAKLEQLEQTLKNLGLAS